jgi:NAD(P)-dependent dehydrogenase (short-subunit alcohol dehydrogenase family)
MTAIRGGVAAITGAGSGIGRALAIAMAREGAALALADVDPRRLDDTARLAAAHGVRVTAHETDVSDRGQVERFSQDAATAHGRVTVLVNNAGVAVHGTFADLTIEDFEWLLGINYWGVLYGMKAFLPVLRREPEAHIVNVSSIFGIVAPPAQAAYVSSKFAVRGLTEVVRHEYAGTGLHVTSVHPGGVATNIVASARYHESVPPAVRASQAIRFSAMARTSADGAAAAIVRGVRRNAPRVLIGADARGLDLLQRLLPGRYWAVVQAFYDRHFNAPVDGAARSRAAP